MTPLALLRDHGADEALLDHHERVAARLASWGCPDTVVTAGLVHGAYSTEGYDRATLSLDERHLLRAVVGRAAEELAYRFCATEPRALLRQLGQPVVVWTDRFTRKGVTLDPEDVRPLLVLLAANELDALPSDPPEVTALVKALSRGHDLLPLGARRDLADLLS